MKKIICLVLAAMMIFALVACNSTQESDIDELKQRITQLEDKNKALEDELHNQKLKYDDKLTQQERKYDDELKSQEEKNSELESNLKSLTEQLESIKIKEDEYFEYKDMVGRFVDMVNELQYIIDNLTRNDNADVKGLCYSLDLAFYSRESWLTKEDIKHISYYRYGKVWEGKQNSSNWTEIEFEPNIEKQELTPEVERDIINAYCNFYKHNHGAVSIEEYYGCYNDAYVVKLDIKGYAGDETMRYYSYDGIMWSTASSAEIYTVFKYFDN